jgi:hypothetical protein
MRQKITTGFAAAATALVLGATLAAPAQATGSAPGSLAEVLGVDTSTAGTGPFDHNRYDFDILREAAEVVLAAKPDSPVAVLADGSTPVTAFLPNDKAFQRLEYSLTGSWERKEQKVFEGIVEAAATLGDPVDVVEQILLYHVLPGAAVDSATVLSLKGAPEDQRTLTMANDGTVVVKVLRADPHRPYVVLRDQDPDAPNAVLLRKKLDIRAGSQIAHGISQVLRPLDLPRAS